MKKQLSKLNIISICLLGIFLVVSSLGCIKLTYQALPADDLIGWQVEYKNMLSIYLVITVLLQAALWFINRKLFRGIGIALSVVASLMCVVRMFAISVSGSLAGGPTVSLTPLGFSAIILSIVIVILTVVSFLQMRKAITKT